MKQVNTMYSPHRMVTPAPQNGVTIEEIEEAVNKLIWAGDPRPYPLLFAILKEGCSIPKLIAFTRYDADIIRATVESLREQGHLFTGTLSTQYVLSQVPGSEDLIERITGQRIPKKESPKMARPDHDVPPGVSVIHIDETPDKPKRKYKPRAKKPRPAKGDGTLRIAKARAPLAGNIAVKGLKFTISYTDNETQVEMRGDSLPKLNRVLRYINELMEGDES